MRNAPHRLRSVFALPLAVALTMANVSTASAQTPALDELISAVVQIKTFINPDGRTLQNLGREREGSGIVIDGNGLVLTIGYLMVEAHAAEVTTNDGRTAAGQRGRLRPRDRVRTAAGDRAAQGQAAGARQVGGREGARRGRGRELRRPRPCRRARSSWPSASSPATGNTCSTRRSSPRRRIRNGAARR